MVFGGPNHGVRRERADALSSIRVYARAGSRGTEPVSGVSFHLERAIRLPVPDADLPLYRSPRPPYQPDLWHRRRCGVFSVCPAPLPAAGPEPAGNPHTA